MFEQGNYEFGLKTGDLSEEEMIKIFKKANRKVAKWLHDSRIPRGLNMLKPTGSFGSSTPDTEPPEYDHIYRFTHRLSNLFIELYPNREKNGRIKFLEDGIIWNLHIIFWGSGYTPKLSEDDPIDEFGPRVLQELFQMLPCEKVLIRKTDLGEEWL